MTRLFILLLAICAGACASTGHAPQPFPRPGGPENPPAMPAPSGAPAATAPADAYGITGSALALRGTPYRNGGADPAGFDCSGFVWYVFAQHGIAVPRTVGEQYQIGQSVGGRALEPGDLVFFATTAGSASHVGIALGSDEFVHAPSSKGEVRVERLSGSYWAVRFIGARRVM